MPTVGNVRSVTRDFAAWIRMVDPDRAREERRTIEYEFGTGRNRRVFRADPSRRGAYDHE